MLMAFSATAYAEQQTVLTGTVTKVRDGDTIEVGRVPIRLNGVAAPEKRDALGVINGAKIGHSNGGNRSAVSV